MREIPKEKNKKEIPQKSGSAAETFSSQETGENPGNTAAGNGETVPPRTEKVVDAALPWIGPVEMVYEEEETKETAAPGEPEREDATPEAAGAKEPTRDLSSEDKSAIAILERDAPALISQKMDALNQVFASENPSESLLDGFLSGVFDAEDARLRALMESPSDEALKQGIQDIVSRLEAEKGKLLEIARAAPHPYDDFFARVAGAADSSLSPNEQKEIADKMVHGWIDALAYVAKEKAQEILKEEATGRTSFESRLAAKAIQVSRKQKGRWQRREEEERGAAGLLSKKAQQQWQRDSLTQHAEDTMLRAFFGKFENEAEFDSFAGKLPDRQAEELREAFREFIYMEEERQKMDERIRLLREEQRKKIEEISLLWGGDKDEMTAVKEVVLPWVGKAEIVSGGIAAELEKIAKVEQGKTPVLTDETRKRIELLLRRVGELDEMAKTINAVRLAGYRPLAQRKEREGNKIMDYVAPRRVRGKKRREEKFPVPQPALSEWTRYRVDRIAAFDKETSGRESRELALQKNQLHQLSLLRGRLTRASRTANKEAIRIREGLASDMGYLKARLERHALPEVVFKKALKAFRSRLALVSETPPPLKPRKNLLDRVPQEPTKAPREEKKKDENKKHKGKQRKGKG